MNPTFEDLIAQATQRAEGHFQSLVTHARHILPDVFHADIPTDKAALGTMFTASAKSAYITLMKNTEGFAPFNVWFRFKRGQWCFDRFSFYAGTSTFNAIELKSKNLPDILLMSKTAFTYRNTQIEDANKVLSIVQ